MARWGTTRWGTGRWGEAGAPGIVGDVTIGLSANAEMAHARHDSIVGDITLSLVASADMEYTVYSPGIVGSITLSIFPTANMKYTQTVTLPAPKGLRLVSWLRPAL
jgi:hypothetical protein